MARTVICGDIHGRRIWRDIVEREAPQRVVFLGDYVSSHQGIDAVTQIDNLHDILDFDGCEKIMLRGNHDLQHLGYYWAACSGFDREVAHAMQQMKTEFLEATQWAYRLEAGDRQVVMSHAGISQPWLDEVVRTVDVDSPAWIDDLNLLDPSEKFGFNGEPGDFTGESPAQPCTWIRPYSLLLNAVKGYTQVVGHTPQLAVRKISLPDGDGAIWLCDALGSRSYLVIADDRFIIRTI